MKYVIEVRRRRSSVTQGSAVVCVNGIDMVTFSDDIVQVGAKDKVYGDVIDGWASVTPDEEFIRSFLFHPFESYYGYSRKFKKLIDDDLYKKVAEMKK